MVPQTSFSLNLDFEALLASALRSQAAYLEDPVQAAKAFGDLGLEFIGQYTSPGHQAVLSRDHENVYLSISGTRFGQSGGAFDLFEDIDLLPLTISTGVHVTAGAFDGLDEMWAWAKKEMNDSTVFTVDGHSLGAWRARYTALFLPPERIGAVYSFESPKGANAAFWEAYPMPYLTSVVNGGDSWSMWPRWGTEWVHPDVPLVHLLKSGYDLVKPSGLPDMLVPTDHAIESIVQRLRALT